MKICLAGEGAQGGTHMQALQEIDSIEVATLAGGVEADAGEFAHQWKIPHYSLDMEECLSQDGVEAVILASPNQLHASQVEQALRLGKHVLVEIPMGLNLEECERIAQLENSTGLVCMVAHTQRYAPATRELRRMVQEGELTPHHLIVHTYFFRRENINRFGKPRTWPDDLLWHQACHAIDLVYWLFEDRQMEVWAQTGRLHPKLGIPMDLTIGMRTQQGCLVSAAMSFNNHGPIQADYRLIGEEKTILLDRGRLLDWEGNETSIPAANAVVQQDLEFLSAIEQRRAPLTSCHSCLPVMELIHRIQASIDGQ